MKQNDYKFETNKTVIDRMRRAKLLSCSYCKPNQNENLKRGTKYFSRSWKDKTMRHRQFNVNV